MSHKHMQYDPNRRWLFNDLGASQWTWVLTTLQKQQDTINGLLVRVASLEREGRPTRNLAQGEVV